jgi:hypothetical protein
MSGRFNFRERLVQKVHTFWSGLNLGALVALSFGNVLFLLLAVPAYERIATELDILPGKPVPWGTTFISSNEFVIIGGNVGIAAICTYLALLNIRYMVIVTGVIAGFSVLQLVFTAFLLFWAPMPMSPTGMPS